MSILQSLTATYTDSEGEDGNEDVEEDTNSQVILNPGSDSNSRSGSPASGVIVNTKAKLVSYHDDTIVSDDEGHGETNVTKEEDEAPPEPEPITDDGIQLPPEPPGRCSAELQEKILRLHEKMLNSGLDMNHVIQQRKDFRNPSIYEKLIQFCGINELGTNYPPNIYDPLRWGKESFYEDLAKVQKIEMDKREKERKAKVEFVSGTKRPNAEEELKKRKSKWDQPGGNSLGHSLKPAGLVQPSLTTSATGTKGTVISAFGSLPKKPRI